MHSPPSRRERKGGAEKFQIRTQPKHFALCETIAYDATNGYAVALINSLPLIVHQRETVMRRSLLLTTTILVTITFLRSLTVQTQQPEKDQFPKPETYPDAGPYCKNKVQLAPWLGMPGAGPGKNRCLLTVYNCRTDTTDIYQSGPRESGTVSLDCSDYDRAKDALAIKFICCDNDCEQPKPLNNDPPWLDKNAPCQNRQQGTYSWGQNRRNSLDVSVSISICGQVIRFVQPAMGTASGDVRPPPGVRSFDVCCDSWQNAVSTRSPCNAMRDIDCDGTLNESDFLPLNAPRRKGSAADFVSNSPLSNLPFWRQIHEAMPSQNDCKDCKWELVGIKYNCENKVERTGPRSESRNAEYEYEATWTCPDTGQATVKNGSATMEGQNQRRGSPCCRCPTPPNGSWP